MTGRADIWIRRTTTGCVALLALIAGTVSYLHMHRLVALHGQPGWVATLTPLSVDGMIVAASATLLAESRAGRRGAALDASCGREYREPGSQRSCGRADSDRARDRGVAIVRAYRVMGALTRQIRCSVAADGQEDSAASLIERDAVARQISGDESAPLGDLQCQAWRWAVANRRSDGALPAGSEIARQYGRHERWGRLVKSAGLAGDFADITPDKTAGDVTIPRPVA